MTNTQLGLHFSDAEDVAKYFTPEEAALCIEQWYGSIRAVGGSFGRAVL